MKNSKKAHTWKQIFQIYWRAIKLLSHVYPQLMISRFLCTVWTALTPYVNIYLSALIIEEMSGGRNPRRLLQLVGITLLLAGGISLGTAFLTKWKNVQEACHFYKDEAIFSKKLFDMDFICIDDAKVQEQFDILKQYSYSGGWGIFRVVSNCDSLISSVFTFLGGIPLTITLFTRKVPESAGGYRILNNALFLLLVFGVMLAVTYLAPIFSTKAGSYWSTYAGAHRKGNLLFGYFGFTGYNKDLAADMRIYRQDVFSDKYTGDKKGAFCSQGMFAKFGRGPMGLLQAASAAVSVIFTAVVYLFVCLKAWAGAFGVGAVTQYIAAITKASSGVSTMIATVGNMKNNTPFLEQVFDFLDIPNPMYQGSLTVEKRRDRDYEVEFKNVSFKYPGSDNWALRNVNMKFKVGSRMAVVGRNGSGKTTFIKLLCRLYDPTEGEILLNGINIRKYNYLDYLMIFSVVFQDFKLFSLKLGENVASGVEYDRELAEDCLRKAGFGERLAAMPEGLDTYLYKDFNKDGVDVSGGEAQKIALARALYKDAPFIVLDEPTAALDPIAEAEIYTKFNDIVDDKTAIYISHRLSSCKFCDEIAVFKDGAVVQKGSHSTLLADEGGEYYELWHAQAQYYTA
ncbi:MAG: ABC transporter ATP-binding protein [Lachnospiraceae bacterium]|nr:ABC transporter ATP-binding protein [Lachnospiraceae bacterium]